MLCLEAKRKGKDFLFELYLSMLCKTNFETVFKDLSFVENSFSAAHFVFYLNS